MGSSKSYRGAPGWEAQNTPRGETKVSKGDITKAEGTHTSGYDDYGRKGHGGRNKSKSGRAPARNKGPHGYS